MKNTTRPSFLPFGIFFFLLVHLMTSVGIMRYIIKIDAVALKIRYIEGTTDMILESQNKQHSMLVALVENSN